MSGRGRSAALGCALAAALALACDTLDPDRRPYTPFPVASGEAEKTADGAAPSPAPPAPPPVTAKPSLEPLVAPSRAVEWRVGERQLAAPSGLIFRLALLGGVRGGGERDVLAWAVGAPEAASIGELWLYPESGEPRSLLAAPAFLPTGPGCSHGARLAHAGPSSVTLDIESTCAAPLLPRAPQRSVTLLAPLRSPPTITGFRLAAPARDERLDLEVSAADRDGDGRDDVEMNFRFGVSAAADVRARFVWLARAAGLSRDMGEPRASFIELTQPQAGQPGAPPSSSVVAARAASVRRMYASLCAEAGTPRIFLDDGAALECGDLSAAFEALTSAEVDAALAAGQVVEGFAALERHAWFAAGAGRGGEAFIKRQLAKLTPRVARRRVASVVTLKVHPRAVEPWPHYSPLSFHADGSVLVLTLDGLVRAAPDGRYEYEASDEIDPWPTVVSSSRGEQLAGIAFPCDRSEVVWLRAAADGAPLEPLPTRLVAPRPGSCAAVPFAPPPVSAVGWDGPEPAAFVGASLVGSLPAHPPPGSAASPNGRHAIVPTRWGLLVTGGRRPQLWSVDNAALLAQLGDCVISNDAQAAACLSSGRAQVLLPDPKSG